MGIIDNRCLTSYIKDVYAHIYPFCYNNNKALYFNMALYFINTHYTHTTHTNTTNDIL